MFKNVHSPTTLTHTKETNFFLVDFFDIPQYVYLSPDQNQFHLGFEILASASVCVPAFGLIDDRSIDTIDHLIYFR